MLLIPRTALEPEKEVIFNHQRNNLCKAKSLLGIFLTSLQQFLRIQQTRNEAFRPFPANCFFLCVGARGRDYFAEGCIGGILSFSPFLQLMGAAGVNLFF